MVPLQGGIPFSGIPFTSWLPRAAGRLLPGRGLRAPRAGCRGGTRGSGCRGSGAGAALGAAVGVSRGLLWAGSAAGRRVPACRGGAAAGAAARLSGAGRPRRWGEVRWAKVSAPRALVRSGIWERERGAAEPPEPQIPRRRGGCSGSPGEQGRGRGPGRGSRGRCRARPSGAARSDPPGLCSRAAERCAPGPARGPWGVRDLPGPGIGREQLRARGVPCWLA